MDPKRGSRRIGFKTGGAAKARANVGTTRSGLFSKLFKRKPITESTESKPATSKPETSKPATSTGRASQMMATSAGTKGSSNKSTTGSTNRAVTATSGRSEQMMANSAGNKGSTSNATSAAVNAWKARKPTTKTMFNNQMGALGSEIRKKNQAKLDKALAAWRKEDPRKNK